MYKGMGKSDADTRTDPDSMNALYKIFRKGFLESAEGWNGEIYHRNPAAFERRLQAKFEALKDAGKFDHIKDIQELAKEWREASENDAEKDYSHAAGTWAVAAKELEELIDA